MAEENGSSQTPQIDRDALANALSGIGPRDADGNLSPVEMYKPTTASAPPTTAKETTEEEVAETQTETETTETETASAEELEVAATEVELPELDDNDIVGLLQEADVSVNDLQEIREALELRDKYTTAQREFAGLTEDERRRIAIGREFGDSSLYDRVNAINADVLPEKEILRQVYFLENTDKSVHFLDKQFERNYKRDYEDEDDDDFAKLKLAEDVREARDKMKAFQEVLKSKTIGSAQDEATADDSEERQQAWNTSVATVLESVDRVTYELDGVPVTVVMDTTTRETIQDAMNDPIKFINELITDEKGNHDHEALFEFIMRNMYFEKILLEAKNTGKANFQETQLKQLQNKGEQKNTSKMVDTPKPTARDAFANSWT